MQCQLIKGNKLSCLRRGAAPLLLAHQNEQQACQVADVQSTTAIVATTILLQKLYILWDLLWTNNDLLRNMYKACSFAEQLVVSPTLPTCIPAGISHPCLHWYIGITLQGGFFLSFILCLGRGLTLGSSRDVHFADLKCHCHWETLRENTHMWTNLQWLLCQASRLSAVYDKVFLLTLAESIWKMKRKCNKLLLLLLRLSSKMFSMTCTSPNWEEEEQHITTKDDLQKQHHVHNIFCHWSSTFHTDNNVENMASAPFLLLLPP